MSAVAGLLIWGAAIILYCTVWWPLPPFSLRSMAVSLAGMALLMTGGWLIFGHLRGLS